MTSLYDFFSHGSEYEGEGNVVDEPRAKTCGSCAFTNCKDTVRPKEISLTQMLTEGDNFDVFYCHEPDKEGKLKICAGWYREFGELCLPRHFQAEKETDAILNKDEC